LATGWQWPQSEPPAITIEPANGGWLELSSVRKQSNDQLGAILSRPVTTANFVATTLVDGSALKADSTAGLSAYQGSENAVGITVGRAGVSVYLQEGKKHRIIAGTNAVETSRIYLRMTVKDGARFQFAFSQNGSAWTDCGTQVEVSYLESARIALTTGGGEGTSARFAWLRVVP
jgi:beta-xylosidase